jgi:hypothetical protein
MPDQAHSAYRFARIELSQSPLTRWMKGRSEAIMYWRADLTAVWVAEDLPERSMAFTCMETIAPMLLGPIVMGVSPVG